MQGRSYLILQYHAQKFQRSVRSMSRSDLRRHILCASSDCTPTPSCCNTCGCSASLQAIAPRTFLRRSRPLQLAWYCCKASRRDGDAPDRSFRSAALSRRAKQGSSIPKIPGLLPTSTGPPSTDEGQAAMDQLVLVSNVSRLGREHTALPSEFLSASGAGCKTEVSSLG